MKKLVLIVALVVALLLVTACQTGEAHIAIPTQDLLPAVGEEAPDDIVFPPPGVAYRANVHHQGVENPWPPIESTEVTLSNLFGEICVGYRDYIETEAGETRNNIFRVGRAGGFHEGSLNLYATSIPSGIELARGICGGMPGTLTTVLIIKIATDIAPGQYSLEIGLEVKGRNYSTVPCIIEVVE